MFFISKNSIFEHHHKQIPAIPFNPSAYFIAFLPIPISISSPKWNTFHMNNSLTHSYTRFRYISYIPFKIHPCVHQVFKLLSTEKLHLLFLSNKSRKTSDHFSLYHLYPLGIHYCFLWQTKTGDTLSVCSVNTDLGKTTFFKITKSLRSFSTFPAFFSLLKLEMFPCLFN